MTFSVDPIYEEKEQQDKQQNNRGPKIDYVLADKDTVYLVELKTTSGSIKKKQANRYITHCYGKDGKTFGEVFGDKLLQIMTESAQKAKIDIPTQQKEAALYAAFQQIVNIKDDSESYADTAKCFLKREHGAGTDKYLYTMGQLLDYLYDRSGTLKGTIWDKPLRLIYLTPDGGKIIPKKSYQNNKQAWDAFYLDLLRPTEKGSVSLNDFSSCFSDTDTKDDLAQLLEQILKDIY